jgi:hypothetical protein
MRDSTLNPIVVVLIRSDRYLVYNALSKRKIAAAPITVKPKILIIRNPPNKFNNQLYKPQYMRKLRCKET